MSWVVIGRFCPTDANPETDADDHESRSPVCESWRRVEHWRLYFKDGGRVVRVKP